MAVKAHRIAMIDGEGGYGIGGYTYELSEGLAANGIHVDVYSNSRSEFHRLNLPRHHRVFPVLGRALFKQRDALKHPVTSPVAQAEPSVVTGTASLAPRGRMHAVRSTLRDLFLPAEFAVHLKRQNYDLVWRQWGEDVYGSRFSAICSTLGLRVVHTVHNVLPHEETDKDTFITSTLYRRADKLVAHSNWAKLELVRLFPGVEHKIIVARLGLYTMFPRVPRARKRVREALEIPQNKTALLFFGGVRPYKNIDSVLTAMTNPELGEPILVVAGAESGYTDCTPDDPLGRTRRIAKNLGIAGRVRLLPGPLDLQRTAELFEASDVLVLPYLKSYGSALLLLGMTFGKFIAATETGGMEEYLASYPRNILLKGPSPTDVTKGLALAIHGSKGQPNSEAASMPELMWTNIARDVLTKITAVK